MSTTQAAVDQLDASSEAKRGGLLTSTDHKRIGASYLVVSLIALLMGGLIALIVRVEQMGAETMFEQAAFGRYLSLQGVLIGGLFVVPGLAAAFGNFAVPLMVGARDVAFPKLNRLGLYAYVGGAVLAVAAALGSGGEAGWSAGAAFGLALDAPMGLLLGAALLLSASAIITGINMVVTVHTMRAPGLTWSRLPLFAWGAYTGGLVQVLAAPVLVLGIMLVSAERTYGLGLLDPQLGGDPVFLEQLFWFYAHPALAALLLPALGAVAEVISAGARKTPFGYRSQVVAFFLIGALSFVIWGQHLVNGGQSAYASAAFSALALLALVPAGLVIINQVTTLYGGSVSLDTPMLFGLGSLVLFAVGTLSGALLASLGTGAYLQGTGFAAGWLHYLVGAGVMGFFAALHHWWPKMTGRRYAGFPSRASAVLLFIGLNAAFFPELVAGAKGMPERIQDAPAGVASWLQFSSFGLTIAGVSLVVMIVYLVASMRGGAAAGPNPWGARSLEWSVASPPPAGNFPEIPTVVEGAYEHPIAEDHGHVVESGVVEA